jgi:hypothetical protein
MLHDIKELIHYIYPILPFTNDFYNIEKVPMKNIPKSLQIQSRLWVHHLNILFHSENEVISEMTLDIEAHLIVYDFKNIPDPILPPHEALHTSYEYGYRYAFLCL